MTKKIMQAKIMKGKLAILAMTSVLALTLTACEGYYPYDYRYGYYSPYGDYKVGPGYYPYMYDWYSQPLYGRGNYGGRILEASNLEARNISSK